MATKRMMIGEVLAHIARARGLDREKAKRELFGCLRHGELFAEFETMSEVPERWRAIQLGKGAGIIPAHSWNAEEFTEITDDTVRFPKHWPEPGWIGGDNDYQYAHGVHVSREEVERLWPLPVVPLEPVSSEIQPTKVVRGRKDRRGASADYDWEKALIVAAVFIDQNGPAKQGDVVDHVLSWFGDDGPSQSTVADHIAPLYRALRSGKPPE
jgi:hypothetical protein